MMVSEDRLHQNAYAFWLLSLPQLATGKSFARRRPAARAVSTASVDAWTSGGQPPTGPWGVGHQVSIGPSQP
jgi:hypothetical protein